MHTKTKVKPRKKIKVKLLAFPRICLLDLRNMDFMTLQQVVRIEIPAARDSARTLLSIHFESNKGKPGKVYHLLRVSKS